GHAARKLVQARLSAAWQDAQIRGDFRAPASLDRHNASLLEKLFAALPQVRLNQVTAIHPAGETGGRADFDTVVAAGKDFDAVAIEQNAGLLADLSDAAPKSDGAFADVGLAEKFVFGPEEPSEQSH